MLPSPPAILIVDDDITHLHFLKGILEDQGYLVRAVASGEEALLHLDGSFALVLLDISRRFRSALKLLSLIRKQYPATQLPIIVMAGLRSQLDVQEAIQFGASDYILKPVHPDFLTLKLQALLQMQTSRAALAATELNLTTRERRLEEAHASLASLSDALRSRLEDASRLQQSLLPEEITAFGNARFSWEWRPAEELAGDLLGIVPLDAQRVGLYVLDVSSHGVAAALLAVTVSRFLSSPTEPGTLLAQPGPAAPGYTSRSPADVLHDLNRKFPMTEQRQYFTLAYGIYDALAGTFTWASAGHPPLLHVPRAGQPILAQAEGPPIGFFEEATFEIGTLRLDAGDQLFIYSDGVTGTRNRKGEEYGEQRLLEFVRQDPSATPAERIDRLMAEVERFAGSRGIEDDSTVLCMEVS